ncbi:MATE family efflux transporter [Phocaeicola vulgatus]|uniref:MATE family efflux transporter n=6 Tax=Bacteroidales TaxID=171549 RepID=A0A395VIZ2_PHOVU|nr:MULTISPECIES: MATE family efflux transporter [Phocaeicola]HAY25517.1 MATE family efflux transporter [Bacteroides sp.]ABR39306.1 putative transmembrane transport efflux protein [Phocaeicola vulgatus ATCC 8482]EFG19395.1 MATE efflux family protein [Phocaeicola vulgatus PC510]KAB3550539.1 MATE family efflux transporter [Phocaeicola vulgatus]KAB3552182.1 MATE family efflux transporter [Phocaeicola vulgatus]
MDVIQEPRSVRKNLARLAVPIFIETLLIMMLGAVDTVMLSQYSDNSVAAVGVVNQLIMFAFLIFEVINIGTSVLCSQYLGARMHKNMVQVVGVSLILNLVFGLFVSAILHYGATSLLSMMGLRPELMEYGVSYMKIVGAFAFFQAISLTISASLRSANKAVYPMMVTVVVNILNIIGNYSLIFGKFGMPALGVEGAAISTAFARGVSMVILFVILFRKHIPRFPLSYFCPFPFVELKNLLKIGVPSAGENMSYSFSQVVLTYFINMLGNEALATRTYVVNIVMFVYLFAIAMAQGGAICIGHLVGERKIHAAYLLGKYVMRISILVSLVLSCIWALMGHTLFSWLTDNPEIIRLGTIILFIDVILEVGRAINIYATNALRATGDVNYPFYVGFVVQWSVAVGCGFLFGIHWGWGLVGMWCAFVLDENLRGIIFVQRWNSLKWTKKGFVK